MFRLRGISIDARLATPILLILYSLPAPAFATTIIALRTAEFVIIAADSKPTYMGAAGTPTVCKIYNRGELYFAVSGLDHDARRGFYVKNIVAQSLSSNGRFDDQVARLEQSISQSLMAEISRLRQEDPGMYMFTVRNGKEIVSLVLAQNQDGVPHLAARGFSWIANPVPAIKIDRVTCPGDCSDGRELVSLGEKTAAEKFLRDNAGQDFDLPALATKLVQLEIDNSPSDVGPPINELRLDKNGAAWLSNGAGCPVAVQ